MAQANAELAAAQDKLSVIKRKVQSLEEQLAKLTADFEKATADKLRCQKEADATQATIQLANRLVGGLASENVRWAEAVAEYEIRLFPLQSGENRNLCIFFTDLWHKELHCPATHCSLPPSFRMLDVSRNNFVWI